MTYSFPCQALSVQGKGLGMDEGSGTSSSLLWEVKRILKGCHQAGTLPKYLLMENVANIAGPKHLANFEKWQRFLSGIGYTSSWAILNSRDYGSLQNRKRCYMVSILNADAPFVFPDPKPRLQDVSYAVQFRGEDECSEDYFEKIHDMDMGVYSCAIRGRYVAGGGTRQQLEVSGMESVNTLTTVKKDSMVLIKDQLGEVLRPWTVHEAGRLMGLYHGDIYRMRHAGISDAQLYKMFGNSIVVEVLEEIFKQLFL